MQYHANSEERREERRKDYWRTVGQPSPAAALQAYQASVMGGPLFGCAICCQHFYQSAMVRLEQVADMPCLKDNGLLNMYFTHHLMAHQLRQLDSFWCCRFCKEDMAKGSVPSLAQENGLSPTWLQLPELVQEEHEATSLMFPVVTVSSLSCRGGGREARLLVPSSKPINSSSLGAMLTSVHSRSTPYTLRCKVRTHTSNVVFFNSNTYIKSIHYLS